MKEYFRTDRKYDRFFYYSNYTVNNNLIYSLDNNELIDFINQNDIFYFEKECQNNTFFKVLWDMNPNFEVSHEIVSINGTYVKLKVLVETDFVLENVTVLIEDFEDIYINWLNSTQNNDGIISFRTDLNKTTNIFYLEAFTEVPKANYILGANEIFRIDNDFNELDIKYNYFLGFSVYSESFELDIEDNWELDGIHYQNQSYTINDENVFYVSNGFDSSILTAYLQFYLNPIKNYTITQLNSYVIIQIETYIDVKANIEFFVDKRSYRILNDSSIYYKSGIDSYTIPNYQLSEGKNAIIISLKNFEESVNLWLLIPIIIGIVAFVVWYFWKNRENEREKEVSKIEKTTKKEDSKND
jgi:hypothetical protein